MINMYPADYEKLRHNWLHVYSQDINAKFIRLDNLPSLSLSSTWSEESNKLLGLTASLETISDFAMQFIDKNSTPGGMGYVKASPPAWGGSSKLSFDVKTLVTDFANLKKYPKILMNGKEMDPTSLAGSLTHINKLIELVSPYLDAKKKDSGSNNEEYEAVRFFPHASYREYAKYIPLEVNTDLVHAAGKDSLEQLGFTDLRFSNLGKVLAGLKFGDGSNVAKINTGTDKRLIKLTFAQNEKVVYSFGHHFVPTNISVDPAPTLIRYFDDNNKPQYTVPYFIVNMKFEALSPLDAKMMTSVIRLGEDESNG